MFMPKMRVRETRLRENAFLTRFELETVREGCFLAALMSPSRERAEEIAHRCNLFDALMEAIEDVLDHMDSPCTCDEPAEITSCARHRAVDRGHKILAQARKQTSTGEIESEENCPSCRSGHCRLHQQ